MSAYPRSSVVIHQQTAPSISSNYTASSGSYASSSNGFSSPRSMSPADESYLRVYGAENHQSATRSSRKVTVVNRRQVGYEKDAPTPNYAGGYSRR